MNIKKYEVAGSGLLDQILDNITSAVFLINEHAEIQAYNKTFTKKFKIGLDNIVGALFGNAIRCHYPEMEACGTLPNCNICKVRNSILATIFNRENFENYMFPHDLWEDEILTTKYFKISTRPIEYNGTVLALVILDDVTELEKQKILLEEQNQKLLEINELKNRFLGIAAHDLRNPLAAIQGCSMIMSRTLDTNSREEMIQLLEIIREKSQFSLNLIDDLLDITKIESGRMDFALEVNDYAEMLRESCRIYILLASSRNVNIDLQIEENLPPFKFDKEKIERSFNNLIDNSIKYSPEGSKITVQAYKDNYSVVTKVIDQGFGIPEQELPNIFDPFHRAKVNPGNKQKSTGLGLAIVKKIIEGHKGHIEVESELAKGSVFMYTLPILS